MTGKQVIHVKDLLPNGFYVILGLTERFLKDVSYRANGIHEDYIKPKAENLVARRVFKEPPRDVRQYPISNLLQMSNISLVNAGFLPQQPLFRQQKVANATHSTPDLAHNQPEHFADYSRTSARDPAIYAGNTARKRVPAHGSTFQKTVIEDKEHGRRPPESVKDPRI